MSDDQNVIDLAARRRAAAAERQRQCRKRQRDGRFVIPPPAISHDVIEMLIDTRWLLESEAET